MDKKNAEIQQMLSLIKESSHQMPNYVFRFFLDSKKKSEEKPFYNLIADSFLTLFAFCDLMGANAWSQAFTILRMGIEEVAAVYLLTTIPGSLNEYMALHALKIKYLSLKTEEERESFRKENGISKNRINSFFDYGWVAKFTKNGKYGRNEMIILARLEELVFDIEQSLNAFSHGSISVFQMSGDHWNVMRRYGRRARLICCKLYDFLCCSYHKLIGDDEFAKLPLDDSFQMFKKIYLDVLESDAGRPVN